MVASANRIFNRFLEQELSRNPIVPLFVPYPCNPERTLNAADCFMGLCAERRLRDRMRFALPQAVWDEIYPSDTIEVKR